MAILTPNRESGSHWYTLDGRPMHKVPTADGRGERNTTLRDARVHKLLPSVTAIAKGIDKPALSKWKMNQVALAAGRTPRMPEETEDYWVKRVLDAAFEQVSDAAELGSRIHNALDDAWDGTPVPAELQSYCHPVLEWQRAKGLRMLDREVVLVNPAHGFAGRCDVLFSWGDPLSDNIGILDYKTKKTKPGEKAVAYEDQGMQLAAYAATRWGESALPRVLAANVFISTTEPGRMDVCKHEPQDLVTYWECFKALCLVWRVFNGYDPRVCIAQN
jgi:hypothetical protein